MIAACAVPLFLLSGSAAFCQDTETALGDPAAAPVVDPSLANSRYFPPALGTAGVASIAPTPKPGHAVSCSATNPCALPTPARDHVTVAQGKS